MKKVILILSMVMVLFTNSLSFAVVEESVSGSKAQAEQTETTKVEAVQAQNEQTKSTQEELTPAAEKILENSSKKDRKIGEYMNKYNDQTFAYTAYYLDLIQLYSIPVCIIGIAIGAFNFYIIGEKKLDKREKGFSFIMAFLCGLVFFQVLPLVFALLVAGK